MKLRRWLRGWIIASLVAPLVYLGIYLTFGYTLGEGIVIFWPGVLGFMALENRPPMATVVFVWMVSIGSNVLCYTVIALLLWPFARVKSEGPSVDKEKE
jgi:ethanolamine transporter EutH